MDEREKELYNFKRNEHKYWQTGALISKIREIYGEDLNENDFKEKLLYLYSTDSYILPEHLSKNELEEIIDTTINYCKRINNCFSVSYCAKIIKDTTELFDSLVRLRD